MNDVGYCAYATHLFKQTANRKTTKPVAWLIVFRSDGDHHHTVPLLLFTCTVNVGGNKYSVLLNGGRASVSNLRSKSLSLQL